MVNDSKNNNHMAQQPQPPMGLPFSGLEKIFHLNGAYEAQNSILSHLMLGDIESLQDAIEPLQQSKDLNAMRAAGSTRRALLWDPQRCKHDCNLTPFAPTDYFPCTHPPPADNLWPCNQGPAANKEVQPCELHEDPKRFLVCEDHAKHPDITAANVAQYIGSLPYNHWTCDECTAHIAKSFPVEVKTIFGKALQVCKCEDPTKILEKWVCRHCLNRELTGQKQFLHRRRLLGGQVCGPNTCVRCRRLQSVPSIFTFENSPYKKGEKPKVLWCRLGCGGITRIKYPKPKTGHKGK